MASSDRQSVNFRSDKRVIYKISDSRRHLVGPSRLGSLANIRHPLHVHHSPDTVPIHSHLPDLLDHDTNGHKENTVIGHHDPPAECAGFVAAGSWGFGTAERSEASRPLLEGHHPILNAIIEDVHHQQSAAAEPSPRDFARSYSTTPSVLELIPELQRPQSFYYINSSSSISPGSATSIGSSAWLDGLDWSFPSVGTSQQWSGHLKSVLLDVFTPSSDSSLPTILQPRFKKSPGTSAALFVPSVMASIWRQYSDEYETSPEVCAATERPIVNFNKEDYAAPISSFQAKGIALNKGKNAKTACLSAPVKRTSACSSSASASEADRRGRRTYNNNGGKHDMGGGRLARWHSLLKYVLTGHKTQPSSTVELQDMSSYPLNDNVFPSPNHNQTTTPEEATVSPLGEVTFFHYNSDGTEYSCSSVPIITAAPKARHRSRKKHVSSTSCDSMVIIEYSDSDEEDEEVDEKVIEAVLIREFDHDTCACNRSSGQSLEEECSNDADESSFVTRSLSNEFTRDCTDLVLPPSTDQVVIPNGNVNRNCLANGGADDVVPPSFRRRRSSSIKRIPKIIKNKKRKIKFAVQHTNHKHRPKILGLDDDDDDNDHVEQSCRSDSMKEKRRRRWRKHHKVRPNSTEDDPSDEPFEWPDNYISVKVPPSWSPPRSDSEMRRYITVATRYVPTVYVKLYIQVPAVTHLCELKTHLLICILRSFFTTTEGLHINWVMSLQSHVYNLLYMDVARVRFRRDSHGMPCRACLLLSHDATVLVRHKRCNLLTTVADILQIAPEELLVMEKGQRDRSDRLSVSTVVHEDDGDSVELTPN